MPNTNVTADVSARLADPKDWKAQKKKMDDDLAKRLEQEKLEDWFASDKMKPRKKQVRLVRTTDIAGK